MGGRRRSAPAQHPVSSGHPGHPTPGWELRVLGTGAGKLRRRNAAATTAPRLHDRRPQAVEVWPSRKGSHRDSLAVVGSQRSPKASELPSGPALIDAPPSHATPTWMEAGLEEEGWCARTKVGGLLSTL